MNHSAVRTDESSCPLFYRALWWTALFTIVAAALMIYWRILQIVPAVQSILEHKKNEMPVIVRIAVLRQVLRAVCIVLALCQIRISWKTLFLRYPQFLLNRRRMQRAHLLLTLLFAVAQYVALSDLYTNLFMALCLGLQGVQTVLVLKRPSRRGAFAAALLTYALCVLGMFAYGYTYCRDDETAAETSGVSTTAAIHKNILTQIWDMSTENEFYHAAFYEQKAGADYGLIPIPGVSSTDTVNAKTDAAEACTSMTPQGIAMSENYIFVSAYCYSGRHDSVIYVIDREDGSFVKQIVLPERTHAGGLAYDSTYGTLWITTKTTLTTDEGEKKVSALACITDEDIRKYSFADSQAPVAYRNVCPTSFRSNSCLACQDGYIYIGYWMKSKMAMSIAGKFKIRKSGVSVKDHPSEIIHIPGRVQGIAPDGDTLYLTVSYSLHRSSLLKYDVSGENKNRVLSLTDAEQTVSLPQMLEEICLYDNMLYAVFESSARAYRYTAPVCMDHIVKIRLAALRTD